MSEESPRKRRKRKPDPRLSCVDSKLVVFTVPPISHNKARGRRERPSPPDGPKPTDDQPPTA